LQAGLQNHPREHVLESQTFTVFFRWWRRHERAAVIGRNVR
jgi:hypothetical protein